MAAPSRGPCFFPGGLVPIRVDVELDEQRFRESFLWNLLDPDSAMTEILRDAVREEGLSDSVLGLAVQQAQTQLTDLRELHAHTRDSVRETCEAAAAPESLFRVSVQDWREECLHLITLNLQVNDTVLQDQFYWDIHNPHADPDAFAKELCQDLQVEDPEMALAVSLAIRGQLLEVARQAVGWREARSLKKGRRGERASAPDVAFQRPSRGVSLLTLLQGNLNTTHQGISVLRPKEFWGHFSPLVEKLPQDAEGGESEPKEQKRGRSKRRLDE